MRTDKPITIPAMLNPSADLASDFALSMSPSNKKTSNFFFNQAKTAEILS